jgi:hypothetical protein
VTTSNIIQNTDLRKLYQEREIETEMTGEKPTPKDKKYL